MESEPRSQQSSQTSQSVTVQVPQTIATGYHLPFGLMEEKQLKEMGQFVEKLVQNPVQIYRLEQLVWQLLQQDLYYQRERDRGYGRQI
ncbi:MAG: hypothetical protein VKJ24_06085 [Synechococcales bacterium]|nr:hypothetical protein [Synechococcales bacterium]